MLYCFPTLAYSTASQLPIRNFVLFIYVISFMKTKKSEVLSSSLVRDSGSYFVPNYHSSPTFPSLIGERKICAPMLANETRK